MKMVPLLLRNTLTSLFLCSGRYYCWNHWRVFGGCYRHPTDRPKTTVAARTMAATPLDSNNDPTPSSKNNVYHHQQQAKFEDEDETENYERTTSKVTTQKTWLVVGDGDLSYSSSISETLRESDIQLIATVLEDETIHNRVYENSKTHTNIIFGHKPHQVMFGVDATKLESTFGDTKFDMIEFNFPHWRGKTNTKYNRQLINDFLKSAKPVLNPDGGEIRIALCSGQGGMMMPKPSATIQQWRQSWMPAVYASENGLMLRCVESFEPNYQLSSHRGVDRAFRIGEEPQRYVFTFPENLNESVGRHIQLSCRHELRIMLHPDKFNDDDSLITRDDIVHGDAVYELAKEFVPTGYRLEIPARDLLTPYDLKRPDHVPLAVFLLNYSGETRPLTRDAADSIRDKIETEIKQRWKLEIAKAGRLVSRPYPYSLLPTLIKEYNRKQPAPTLSPHISTEEVAGSDDTISFASSGSGLESASYSAEVE